MSVATPTSAQVPSMTGLGKYSVNRPGWEAIRQTLYDFQAYAAIGQNQLLFYQVPAGQGGKTLSDTNMTLAGQLPANQQFLIQSIEVHYFPTVPAVAANNMAAFGAVLVAGQVNDMYLVGRTGNLTLTIGSKPYLQEAPIGRFPPKVHFDAHAALSDASTAAASQQSRITAPFWVGRPYLLSPAEVLLISTQNFSVSINWPEGAQAVTNAGRIGVVLDGFLYRASQ